jgi:soluble lytic murein transglycosylase
VERIPFSETRNYVQRVMENLRVYRVRFDTGASLMTKLDPQHGASQEANSVPLSSAPSAPQ